MKKKLMLFAVSLLAAFPASSGMADGINSGPGVTLPIGAGGNPLLWVNPSGNVYVGTATPNTVPTAYAKLDVQGEIKPGKSIEVCNHLYNEGAIRYDKTAHSMLYCNQNDSWVPLGGVLPGSFCGVVVVYSDDTCSNCPRLLASSPCNGSAISNSNGSSLVCPSGYSVQKISSSDGGARTSYANGGPEMVDSTGIIYSYTCMKN